MQAQAKVIVLAILFIEGMCQQRALNSGVTRVNRNNNHRIHAHLENHHQVTKAVLLNYNNNNQRTNVRDRRKDWTNHQQIQSSNNRNLNNNFNNRQTQQVNYNNRFKITTPSYQGNTNKNTQNQQFNNRRQSTHKQQNYNTNGNNRNKALANRENLNNNRQTPSHFRGVPQALILNNNRRIRDTIHIPNSLAAINNPSTQRNEDSFEYNYWTAYLNLQGQNINSLVTPVNRPVVQRPTTTERSPVHWSYRGHNGFSKWGDSFSECQGRFQSPINIAPHFALPADFGPLIFVNYHNLPDYTMVSNNGHSVQVDVTSSKRPTIFGGGLPGQYMLVQYHLHWGHNDLRGSEHTINHVRYPMELHLVHFKAEYGTVERALQYPDGVAVLGILFEVSRTDNPALTPLVKKLARIPQPGNLINSTEMYPIVTMLPRDLKLFYRYSGSLTTPTCNEAVIWTIFDQAIPISEYQLNAFRNVLLDGAGLALRDNFRPTQPLNDRKIYRSTSLTGQRSITRTSINRINNNLNSFVNDGVNNRINNNRFLNNNNNNNFNNAAARSISNRNNNTMQNNFRINQQRNPITHFSPTRFNQN